jgi:hypothetical protein
MESASPVQAPELDQTPVLELEPAGSLELELGPVLAWSPVPEPVPAWFGPETPVPGPELPLTPVPVPVPDHCLGSELAPELAWT